jgi:nucleolin
VPQQQQQQQQQRSFNNGGEVEGTRVFLGNCSFDINDEAVHEAFDKFGTITTIDWVTDKDTGKFYGTGFINFSTPEEAHKALVMDQQEIAGRRTKVALAMPKKAGGAGGDRPPRRDNNQGPSEKPEGCNTVFVGSLPFTVEEKDVMEHFQGCGEVDKIRWVMKDGEFRGCAFVEFGGDASSAVDAAVKLSGSSMGDRSIRVDYAAPKPPREGGGGGGGGRFGGGGGGGRFGGGGGGGFGGGRGGGGRGGGGRGGGGRGGGGGGFRGSHSRF